MAKLIGNNPACPKCGGTSWKNRHRQGITSYRCTSCKKYFSGELNNIDRSSYPRCPNCKIGFPRCIGGYNHEGEYRRTYQCKNCGYKYTPSPYYGQGNPRLKRKISAREMLELKLSGESYNQIAKKAGVSKNAVICALSKEIVDW